MKEIKKCPFCGSKAEVYEECELVKIRCSNYMCQASVNSWHDEVEDAIYAWNKRTNMLKNDDIKYAVDFALDEMKRPHSDVSDVFVAFLERLDNAIDYEREGE